MAVLRLGRFRAPAGTREMLTRHAARAAAVEDAFRPGLIEMQPAARREGEQA
jgi:hypothetical protein